MLSKSAGLKLGKEAQAKFEEAKTAPDFQGFLDKKGAKRKNWNNRWFVLKDNYLFYCKTTKAPPQGIINLHGCTVTQIEGPTARPYSFSLLAPKSVSVDAKWTNRTYFFAATSTGEMNEWVTILQESGKRSIERAQQKAAAAAANSSPSSPTTNPISSNNQHKTVESDSHEKSVNEEEKKEKKEKKKKKKNTEETTTTTSTTSEETTNTENNEEKKRKEEEEKEEEGRR